MGKGKIEPWEREQVLQDLRQLYLQNMQFIEKNDTIQKVYNEKQIKSLKKKIEELYDYIQDLEYGVVECNLRKEDWCELIADTLLDDDNFPYEEDGFSWH